MKCFGTCLFLRALWADISGEIVPIHIRTDANNLVTTAQTTHLPEQKETHHLIQMLRHESNSGHLDDLSHIASEYCLADPLTKSTAKPDQLVSSITTGKLENVDTHPPFRSLLKHKAFLTTWVIETLSEPHNVLTFFCEDISDFRLCFCNDVLRGVNFRLKKICVCNLSAHRVHIAFSFATPGQERPLALFSKTLKPILETPRRSYSKIPFKKVTAEKEVTDPFYASEILEAWPN